MNPIYDLLVKHGQTPQVSGRDYLIRCLNPEHDDSSPSFRIDQLSGAAHCFSCGFKTNIFKHYGILTIPSSVKTAKLKEKLRLVSMVHKDVELPVGSKPFAQNFRGIKGSTFKHFGICYSTLDEEFMDRMIIPVTDIRDRVIALVGRHTLSDAYPRYINKPAGVKMGVFPPKLEELTDSIILVEGIFDMLNLYDKGIHNVVCCFGTNTLKSDIGQKLLPFKAQGVTKVYILFDGDTAGRNAAKDLAPLIAEHNLAVKILDLKDGEDPGALTSLEIDRLKKEMQQ